MENIFERIPVAMQLIDYISFVVPLIFFAIIVLTIVATRKEFKRLDDQTRRTLTKKDIMDSFNDTVIFFVFGFVVLILSAISIGFIISLKSGELDVAGGINLIAYIPAIVLVGVLIGFCYFVSRSYVNKNAIKNNDFIIYVDVLGDKEEVTTSDSDGGSSTSYYFYFQYLFKNFRRKITVSSAEYRHAIVGDEYYVVFVKPTKKISVFKKSMYDLDYDIRSTFDETPNLETYMERKSSSKKYNDTNYNVPVDENGLYERFKKTYSSANLGIFAAVMSVFFIVGMAFIIQGVYPIGIFLVVFVGCAAFALFTLNNKNMIAKKAIYEGKYNIRPSIITEDLSDLHLKDADKYVFFKVEGDDNVLKCPFSDFGRLNVGDEVYLFYFYPDIKIPDATQKPFAVINPNKYHLANNIQSKLSIY